MEQLTSRSELLLEQQLKGRVKRPTAAKKHAITTRAVNGQWGVGVQYLSFEL